jgi:hypothetical protein
MSHDMGIFSLSTRCDKISCSFWKITHIFRQWGVLWTLSLCYRATLPCRERYIAFILLISSLHIFNTRLQWKETCSAIIWLLLRPSLICMLCWNVILNKEYRVLSVKGILHRFQVLEKYCSFLFNFCEWFIARPHIMSTLNLSKTTPTFFVIAIFLICTCSCA